MIVLWLIIALAVVVTAVAVVCGGFLVGIVSLEVESDFK